MANKQNFTPEEWTLILESVMLAGIAVSAADPNGLWGTVKEAYANSAALRSARHHEASNELVKAALADLETSQGRSSVQKALRDRFVAATPHECVTRSLASLKNVSAILDAIKKLTPLPVRFLIDTEPHPDHTTGHFVFPTATIIAAAGAGDSMRARERQAPLA